MESGTDKQTLEKYLPGNAVTSIVDLLDKHGTILRISKPRASKLGDYRPAHGNIPHTISVNGNLNKYAFTLTLLHEIAHLHNFVENGRRVKPHGEEWNRKLRDLVRDFVKMKVFPQEMEKHIIDCYFTKKAGSYLKCSKLVEVLDTFNSIKKIRVSDLPDNVTFTIKSGKKFIKLNKIRTRFVCKEVDSGRKYFVHGMAEVIDFE